MASPEPWIRLQAADVLCDAAARLSPPAPALNELLLAALQDREALIRTRALEALALLDSDTRRKAVPILLGQLRRPDRPGQLLAAIGLSRFGQEGQASVTILTDRLRGGELASRLADLYLLGRIGPAAMASVPAIVREMTARDAEHNGPFVADGFSPSQNAWHHVELDRLVDSFERTQTPSSLCELGAVVLGRLGPEVERQAVDVLVGMVHDDDESSRTRAVAALGALGPRASAAIPTLLALAERKAPARPGESDVQGEFRLTKALERICTGGDPRFVAALIRMLRSSEPTKHWGAAMTLSHLIPPAPAAVPLLIEALKDDTQAVRFSAAVALGRYEGPERGAALAALLDALRDEDEWVRCMAARSLARSRAGAQRAVPTLVKFLGSEDPNLRREAAEVLGAFGLGASSAVPVLLEARHDPVELVRNAAERSLEAIAASESTSVSK
jgi:HEAT repeat protein